MNVEAMARFVVNAFSTIQEVRGAAGTWGILSDFSECVDGINRRARIRGAPSEDDLRGLGDLFQDARTVALMQRLRALRRVMEDVGSWRPASAESEVPLAWESIGLAPAGSRQEAEAVGLYNEVVADSIRTLTERREQAIERLADLRELERTHQELGDDSRAAAARYGELVDNPVIRSLPFFEEHRPALLAAHLAFDQIASTFTNIVWANRRARDQIRAWEELLSRALSEIDAFMRAHPVPRRRG